jgi:hypothetical protein
MPDAEELANQQKLLTTHRRTLMHYLPRPRYAEGLKRKETSQSVAI